MLGYVISEGRGVADRLIETLAADLLAQGLRLAGAVQINSETRPDRPCDMHLNVLTLDRQVQISQDLGALAKGCRLDPDGLERAVGMVEAALGGGPELLIVNKFGKQEVDGRGFRPAIGRALADGIPVLCAVGHGNLDRFVDFAGDLAERLPADLAAVKGWCLHQTGRQPG